jgi:hypothetical protein
MWGMEDARPSVSVATFAETVEGEVRWVVQSLSFKIQDCQTTLILEIDSGSGLVSMISQSIHCPKLLLQSIEGIIKMFTLINFL